MADLQERQFCKSLLLEAVSMWSIIFSIRVNFTTHLIYIFPYMILYGNLSKLLNFSGIFKILINKNLLMLEHEIMESMEKINTITCK